MQAKKLIIIAAVFILGGVVGLFGSSYLYYKHVFSQLTMQDAETLHWRLVLASKMRLGESDNAVSFLEEGIDSELLGLKNSKFPKNDFCYYALMEAKTYRNLYPSNSRMSSQVTDALVDIQKLETFRCEGALSRLVKQNQTKK
ncbi:MAG TPA: hypothetical protein DDW84_05320 [Phycisphaerales bacterium]|nr:MAG: hypothetical protein A2Y13_05685 [Planctomycetes bacterium GWC2_45_44]HBG78256.1 hypothetical protein [Phycisphaerales bacterium]HBR18807.1 hypothetical protein [Phycisphaerales bacterium]